MTHITDLPTEILIHIFRYYVESESQENLLKIIAKVCLDWKDICSNSSLWTKFDGTVTFKKMMSLCESGILRNTKELILSHVTNLDEAKEIVLFSNLKNVEIINFSNIEKISKNTLSVVGSNCTKLKEIHIGKEGKRSIQLNYDILGTFFAARGSSIVKISLSYCKIIKFPLTIRCISDCCPNLEYLQLMSIECKLDGAFPTKYFQMHCPKLKVLHLDQSIRVSSNSHPSGFPDLEVFSYLDCEGHTITDKGLKCILFNSLKLKFINLTNCNISGTVLCSLPASSLECLYISRSKVCYTRDIPDVLKKWSHSLKEVDISHGTNYAVNKGVLQLVETPTQSPLEYLNISFTKITALVVEEILKKCSHLETLKLDGCRNLGRGMKQTYSCKKEFDELCSKLDDFKLAHPELFESIDIS